MTAAIIWAAIGMALIIGEILAAGTFFLIFFGAAAFVVAALLWAGLLDTIAWQVITFSVTGVLLTLVLRRKVKTSLGPSEGFSNDRSLTLSVDVEAGASALADYQGSQWTVVNTTQQRLTKGSTVTIDRAEGVKLFLK